MRSILPILSVAVNSGFWDGKRHVKQGREPIETVRRPKPAESLMRVC